MTHNRSQQVALPPISNWLVDGFCWYSKRLVTKSFENFLVDCTELRGWIREIEVEKNDSPDSTKLESSNSLFHFPVGWQIVVYGNHPGWWDPIVAMLMRQTFFPGYRLYAPVESKALEKYAVLKKMGFFGLDLESAQGARDFLRISARILESRNASLWLTPEGQFADARDSEKPLMPGLAHLASKHRETLFIPLALEYPFWDQRRAYGCFRLGRPRSGRELGESKQQCATALAANFRENQSALASKVIARAPNAFDHWIGVSTQPSTAYDWFRKLKQWTRLKKFDGRH